MLFAIGAAVFLVLALHPFMLYPLSLLLARRGQSQLLSPVRDERPRIAICMSAFNEERVIVAKVEGLLAMAEEYGPATIHIYVDGAEDSTATLLAPYADRVDLVVSQDRRGKTAGLNLLVQRSSGDLLAFTDANVVTPRDGLVKLAAAFADPTVGCATARLSYSNPDETGMSFAGALYWRLEEAIKTLETETVGVLGVDGAFFMMAREVYEPAPEYLIDDFYVSLCALAQGRRVVSVDEVEVFERNATRAGEEFKRKARIACQAMNVHRALWPRLVRMRPLLLYGYVSHRLLKWLMPFTLALAGLCVLGALVQFAGWAPVALAIALGGAAVALGAYVGFKPARLMLSVATSFAGVGLGVLQSVGGRSTYTVWTPAASIRDGEGGLDPT
ncbi:MAG: glycosyltransferase [Caulobacteraceae bacterium]